MNQLFEKVNPIFSKFQLEKNVEFEIRLGKINRGAFDTNVGQVMFEKILKGLKKYKGWESTKKTNDVAYYHDNIRLVINDDTEETTQVVKDKLVNVDHGLVNCPLDVRFAVAKETPFEKGDIEFTTARQRNREAFGWNPTPVLKGFKIHE